MSKKRFELLTEAQWRLIEPLLPEPKRRKDRRGRPWASNRDCLEGILWLLRTGSEWRFLSDKYPFRPAALSAREARHQVARALAEQQQGVEALRWSQAASIQASLDRRTHQRLAPSVPQTAGSP